jgi:hypothetical protein
MNYKISKKAATELRGLLARKDTANILYEWYREQERDGFDVEPHLMAKRIEAKIQVLEIEIRLHEEFGIELHSMSNLIEWLADYNEMLDSVARRAALQAA